MSVNHLPSVLYLGFLYKCIIATHKVQLILEAESFIQRTWYMAHFKSVSLNM